MLLTSSATSAASSAALPYVIAPSGWDTAYRSSLAAGGAQVTPVVAFGDSVLAGANSTAAAQNSWWLRTMATLKARYGAAGDYHSYVYNSSNLLEATGNTIDLAAVPWSYSGTSAQWTSQLGGLGGRFAQCTAAGQTATCAFSGTSADLWIWQNPSGGTFTVTIDATPYDKNGVANGAGGNPTCNASPRALARISYAGLAAGSHTLVATGTSGTLNIAGLTAYSGSGGILPVRTGIWGLAGLQAFSGLAPSSTSWFAPDVALGSFAPAPKLFVWCHAINDLQTTYSVENYWLASQRIIEGALGAGASVLCVVTNLSRSANWLGGAAGHALLYQDALNRLALAYNVASLNYTGSLYHTQSAAWIATHAVQHPDDTGHADIAQAVLSVIG